MAVATFSLQNCSILFGAPLDGFGEGDAIAIEPMGDRWVSTVGTSGDRLRVDTGEKGYTVKVSLLQSSASNAILSATFIADTETPGGILLPFTFKDPNSNDVFFSPKAYIVAMPSIARSNAGKSHVWTIHALEGIAFFGGVGSPV